MSQKSDAAALKVAESKNQDWCVLPPEQGYPFPEMGWRLFRRIEPPVVNALGRRKPIRDRWVVIFIGGQMTLRQMVSEQNAVIHSIPRLKEN